jgi:glycosyltransferase involved in cell wall biosynthesis
MAMWFKRSRRVPYVYDMDSSIAQQLVEKQAWLRPVSAWFDWCEAKAIRGALAVAPVCNALADLARSRGAAHSVTLHDISQLARSGREATGSLRKRLALDGSPILMYVGNLEAYQGIDLLLEAFALAIGRGTRANLVVAGGTNCEIAAYRAKAVGFGVAERVHFIGPWPAAQLEELLAEADILTAPRIRGVNTPMKVFPYMHSGKPVLVTDLPTHTQILTPEIAMLAPPEPPGFADAIARLAGDPHLRVRLGAAGREFVERNHTFAAHERRVNELYDQVAALLQDRPRQP